MKKLLALTLTMAMLFTMTAMAENKITTNQGTASTDVKATYVAGSPDTTIYSVDITWGSMDFTYTDGSKGTWNPETHSYDDGTDGKWTATGNTITVTNHSNAAVSATISFNTDITTITPIFDNEVLKLATADGTAVDSAPTATSTLTLDGSIESTDIVDGKIGTVTVTIEGYKVENDTNSENNSIPIIDDISLVGGLGTSSGLILKVEGENLNIINKDNFDEYIEIIATNEDNISMPLTFKLNGTMQNTVSYTYNEDKTATIKYNTSYFNHASVTISFNDIEVLEFYDLNNNTHGVIYP